MMKHFTSSRLDDSSPIVHQRLTIVTVKSSCVRHSCFIKPRLKAHCPECDLTAVCCTLWPKAGRSLLWLFWFRTNFLVFVKTWAMCGHKNTCLCKCQTNLFHARDHILTSNSLWPTLHPTIRTQDIFASLLWSSHFFYLYILYSHWVMHTTLRSLPVLEAPAAKIFESILCFLRWEVESSSIINFPVS